jgi:hypothetical protein
MRPVSPSPFRQALLGAFLPLAPLAPLVPLVTGCTGAVSGAQGAGDADTMVTHAVVLIERTVDVADTRPGTPAAQATPATRAAASARFARVAGGVSAGDTLRAIGAALELPARGSCASIRPVEPGTAPAEPVPFVELLDVGRVSVEASGAVTALMPRQLPYVTDVVTGTVYARAAEPAVLPAGGAYRVHVAGTRDFPAFDVSATAPADPGDVSIAQEGCPGCSVKVAAGEATVDFAWPRAATDLVYVEIQPAAVRCTLDEGPPGAAAGLARGSIASALLDEAGSLVVHRLQAAPFQVRGIDDGELRFDFARVIAYVKR